VALPAAAPAVAGAAPLGPVAAPLTPGRVLAMQRGAGNQAVTAMLQRQEKEKTPVEGPGDFGVSGGEPQSAGTVTAKPDGDGVRAESPDVKYTPAKVWLQEGKELGGSQNFGFVQNLVTSTRGAVYRRGGDPAGDITSEPREGHKKAYDAVSDPNDDTKINKRVFPPFYWPPSNINDENTAANPAETDPAAHDQPGFTQKAKVGDGRLTEFTGADQFKLGVAVKKGEAVHMLKAFDWSVSWAMNVDANLNGAGKAVQSAEVQDALRDGPDSSLGEKDWSLRPDSGDVFEGFSTQAEAMKRSPKELLNWLHKAQQYDQVSYQNICAALDAKAPGVTVDIACDTTHVNVGKDVLSASVLRGDQLIHSEGGIRLNSGDSHSLSLSWADAFGSAANIKPGFVLKVELYVTKNRWEVGHGFMAPFNGSSPQLTPGDGRYKVSVSV